MTPHLALLWEQAKFAQHLAVAVPFFIGEADFNRESLMIERQPDFCQGFPGCAQMQGAKTAGGRVDILLTHGVQRIVFVFLAGNDADADALFQSRQISQLVIERQHILTPRVQRVTATIAFQQDFPGLPVEIGIFTTRLTVTQHAEMYRLQTGWPHLAAAFMFLT